MHTCQGTALAACLDLELESTAVAAAETFNMHQHNTYDLPKCTFPAAVLLMYICRKGSQLTANLG
jgi:hypothetical protein